MEEQLKLLIEKVDRILSLLEARAPTSRRRVVEPKAQKPKPPPLNDNEISRCKERFETLYQSWEAGEELQVEKELDAMNPDQLRQFADANDLNVTSKMPKEKVMRLIASRFRERRQLMRTHFKRPSTPD
jgi:hypothetical protein